MQRYFIDEENWTKDQVTIHGDDAHHIIRVMRMEEGSKVICNRPDGVSARCQITDISDQAVHANVLEWLDEDQELPVSVTIAQGLPKGDKWDWILQKGTELGANAFIPFQAKRSVVKWDEKKVKKKKDRWQKIVKEASEQTHRNYIPTVASVYSINELLKASDSYEHTFIAYEEEAKQSFPNPTLYQMLEDVIPGESIMICIGPEGGFAENEVRQLKEAGFQSIRLGPRILRTETASLYALACLSFYFEEMR
ncbi:hypothetical protein J416_05873 [Gracilibacillus halophilus YIM-C55.5]|uniref:Ribosomal RNA small subunit methyltransferase E n=1 Tax=Gracilibacillus halophilus YIM-C55.5 TaxID=1308866 RepID=N4WT47_9BACI|nr:16S rRNA (uracil(1498)-N(3))-methyltransferase [Gracilibacillus halophilus]ENH97515.1 hypothetical protein J416_05873 [Gracilibacillus halophilus YIM-C55.5]